MARRSTTPAEPRNQRAYTFTFPTRAELDAAHAHSARVGKTLAELLRGLLDADIAKHGALPSSL